MGAKQNQRFKAWAVQKMRWRLNGTQKEMKVLQEGGKRKERKKKNLNGTYLNTQKGIRRCKLEEKQAEKEKKIYTVDAP